MAKALAHYLDACIAVQLVTKEEGSSVIETYMKKNWAYPLLSKIISF
jgi:hypothetical protein